MPATKGHRFRSVADAPCGAKGGRLRRRVIRRMVSELAGRMHAPGGVPDPRAVCVPVAIPSGLGRAAEVIDPRRWYRFPLPDGRTVLAGGVELAAICGALQSLAEAQARGDLSGVEEALVRLRIPSWH